MTTDNKLVEIVEQWMQDNKMGCGILVQSEKNDLANRFEQTATPDDKALELLECNINLMEEIKRLTKEHAKDLEELQNKYETKYPENVKDILLNFTEGETGIEHRYGLSDLSEALDNASQEMNYSNWHISRFEVCKKLIKQALTSPTPEPESVTVEGFISNLSLRLGEDSPMPTVYDTLAFILTKFPNGIKIEDK